MSGSESSSSSALSYLTSISVPSGKKALQNLTNTNNFAAKLKKTKDHEDMDESKENCLGPTLAKLPRLDDVEMESVNGSVSESMDTSDTIDSVPQVHSTSSKLSLRSTAKEKKESLEDSTLPMELQTLLSSLYMDVTKRLCLTSPIRCAKFVTFCHRNHHRSPKPEAPYHTQTLNLRVTWQQARYVEFIQTASDMCIRSEFPGEGVFTKLIELILSTNYERSKTSPRQAYISIGRLFRSIVNAFPPCWLDMRPHYIKFFRMSLDIKKLVLKSKEIITTSNKMLSIIFDLIDYTFKHYTEMLNSEEHDQGIESSQESSIGETSTIKSQCFSQWNWDEIDGSTAFCNLKSDSRLERINIVLSLLLDILESDLCMWILHHLKSPREFIFDSEHAPLVVLVFELSQSQRSTRLVKRLFEIFAKAMSMGLSQTHLKLVQRLISLVMVASHTADLEDSVIGIRYPILQPQTRQLIKDFYLYFKEDNRTCLDTYLTCIDMLSLPYVKYEFIDLFLQMFHHPSSDFMTPKKIANIIVRKYWSKYKPKAEMAQPEEDLSREQYFELLLKSLRAYSEMHGLEKIFRYLRAGEKIPPLQTVYDSVHRNPSRGENIIVLSDMAKDKETWLKQLRMQVRMSRPKVNLSPEDICIDKDVLASYRSDLKYCSLLEQLMRKHSESQGTSDIINEWLKFLSKFGVD